MNLPENSNSSTEAQDIKVSELLGLARESRDRDIKYSLTLALEACQLSEEIKNNSLHIDGLSFAGECCIFLGQYNEALSLLEKAEGLIQLDEKRNGVAEIYNHIGNVKYYTGQFKNSLEYHLKALAIREETKDIKGQAASLNNIGMIHQRFGEYAVALEYHHRSLQLKQENNLIQSTWASLNNIGEVYQELGEYTEALNFHFKSLEIIQDIKNIRAEWTVITNIGLCYRALGDFENGLDCLMKSFAMVEDTNDLHGKAISMNNLGSHFLDQGEIEIAAGYFNSGLKLSRKLGNPTCEVVSLLGKGLVNLRRNEIKISLAFLKEGLKIATKCKLNPQAFLIHKALSECYETIGLIPEAYHHHKLYHALKQEVHNEDAGKKLKYLEYRSKLAQSNKEVEIQRMKSTRLVDSMERLRVVMNVKNEFLGIVTHDLKNPLFGIQGLASVIISDFDLMSKEDIIECAHNIRSSSNQMFDLIRNLLEMNSLDSGKITLELVPVSLPELFLKSNSLFFHLAKEKEIVLNFQQPEDELSILADRSALSQVLDNLITNSIKFSTRKTKIDVTAARINDKVVIQVQDEGPGMTKDDHKKLFRRFTQLSAKPTGGENSTGLGLNISKQLTELMNGRIWCDSEKGKGCCFFIELPVA